MFIKYKGEQHELPDGSSAKDLAEKENLREPHQALAASVNGTLKDLQTQLNDGDEVTILSFDDRDGQEIFWHTSAHVLAQAVLRLWPDAVPTIGPPIENGFYYDFANLQISEDDFSKIEKEIKKILKENHKPELSTFSGKQEALKAFEKNVFKCELIRDFDEGAPITAYKQGEFFDLCRGPHLPSLGKIKAFKLLKTSGAYWRGNSENEMLTRIYGVSYPDKEQLREYLTLLEEAKKRDHRLIGNKLDLFSFHPEAPGIPFFHPRGMHIWNTLISYWRDVHREANYIEIMTPQLMSKDLWIKSGHWEHYRDNMFTSMADEKELALKPMSCPGGMIYYASKSHSYREFPLRVAELGHVFRYEPSGAINGLFRVYSFHQDDAHIFMHAGQIHSEILNLLELCDKLYSTFGLEYRLELSTRPEKSIGTDEDWEVTTSGLKSALDEWGKTYVINEADGAFYGPKIDLHVLDALGRSWQCGTIQLDMSLPERFDLTYKDQDGEEKRPIMLHRALFGSVERFFAILIEHFAGRFPLWLSPEPVRILTVADRHAETAHEIARQIQKHNFICGVDDSNESISKKVRNAQLQQVNYMLTIGDKEMETGLVSLRSREGEVFGELQVSHLLEMMEKERETQSLNSLTQEFVGQ